VLAAKRKSIDDIGVEREEDVRARERYERRRLASRSAAPKVFPPRVLARRRSASLPALDGLMESADSIAGAPRSMDQDWYGGGEHHRLVVSYGASKVANSKLRFPCNTIVIALAPSGYFGYSASRL
jgi:hypothetical protein